MTRWLWQLLINLKLVRLEEQLGKPRQKKKQENVNWDSNNENREEIRNKSAHAGRQKILSCRWKS